MRNSEQLRDLKPKARIVDTHTVQNLEQTGTKCEETKTIKTKTMTVSKPINHKLVKINQNINTVLYCNETFVCLAVKPP